MIKICQTLADKSVSYVTSWWPYTIKQNRPVMFICKGVNVDY